VAESSNPTQFLHEIDLKVIVGPTQIQILEIIDSTPGVSNPELREVEGLEKNNSVYQLRQNGLVYGKRAKVFRSPTCWYLTKLGKRSLQKIQDRDTKTYEGWFAYQAAQTKLKKAANEEISLQSLPKLPPCIINDPYDSVHFHPKARRGEDCPGCGVYWPVGKDLINTIVVPP